MKLVCAECGEEVILVAHGRYCQPQYYRHKRKWMHRKLCPATRTTILNKEEANAAQSH